MTAISGLTPARWPAQINARTTIERGRSSISFAFSSSWRRRFQRCALTSKQRFYFFGVELWINEFGIIFFAMMFLMFVIVVSSVIYGRIYCSYACPQMIFSEASIEIESWINRKVTKHFIQWPATLLKLVARLAWFAVLGVVSVFLAFIFISYFVEPRDLLARMLQFDVQTAGGISGAVVTLMTFLDFTLVRQRFCTTVCPYGYLQGILGDANTLLVTYRDEEHACIECKKCVRVCEMGIDIRKSPFQIECIHCGDCVDACGDVLSRLGKETLINYTWGETGKAVVDETRWYRKFGIRDAKRVVVLLVTFFYLSGLIVALSMRQTIMVQLQPVRITMYRLGDDGIVYNRFRVRLVNRGSAVAVRFTAEGLPCDHRHRAESGAAPARGSGGAGVRCECGPLRGCAGREPFSNCRGALR